MSNITIHTLSGISILRDLWSHDSLGVAGATHDWLSGAGLYSNLLYFIAYRLVFTAACLTLPIPCGLMLPSMVIGAGLGRFIGELVRVLKYWCFKSVC